MAGYWKGYNKKNVTRVVGVFYDEVKKDLFDNDSIGKVVSLVDGSNRSLLDDDSVRESYSIDRQISEEEYNLLCDLALLSNEIFLNQYTRGFPSESKASCLLKRIRLDFSKVIDVQREGDDNG